ncbi:MAG: protein SCO1/2 [Cognaticolwellia sp.]|jgi:protein SCO1/2
MNVTRAIAVGTLLLAFAGWSGSAMAELGATPEGYAASTVTERLGNEIDPSLSFVDQDGQAVKFGDYLRDGKPILLTLNYYTCETLCSTQLNGLLQGLQELDWTAGEEFRIVTVSIDPSEGPDVAAGKRRSYLEELGRGPDVEWDFLTGTESNVSALADSIGYGYAYDENSGQWAHPAVLTFVAPQGFVARYLYGIIYPPRDLKFALMEASEGRVGSPVEKLVLSCFRYDDSTGEYTPAAMGVMRLGGIVTLLAMGGLGAVMWRREKSSGQNRSASA